MDTSLTAHRRSEPKKEISFRTMAKGINRVLTGLGKVPRDEVLDDDKAQLLLVRLEHRRLLDEIRLVLATDGSSDTVPVLEEFEGDVSGHKAGDTGDEDELVGHGDGLIAVFDFIAFWLHFCVDLVVDL